MIFKRNLTTEQHKKIANEWVSQHGYTYDDYQNRTKEWYRESFRTEIKNEYNATNNDVSDIWTEITKIVLKDDTLFTSDDDAI